MLKIGESEWNFEGKGVHWLPHIWGTEAMAWRTDLYSPPRRHPELRQRLAARGSGQDHDAAALRHARRRSLHGDHRQAQPGRLSGVPTRAKRRCVRCGRKITKFCVDNKKQIKLFWNDADSQKNGLLNEGVLVGQTWDGPPGCTLKSQGEPVTYQAPREGALAWVDGMSMPTGAENIDQIYAFLEYVFLPEPAGRAIDKHGYNSAVLGADKFASAQYAKNFVEAYPGDALKNLNPWPWPSHSGTRTSARNSATSSSTRNSQSATALPRVRLSDPGKYFDGRFHERSSNSGGQADPSPRSHLEWTPGASFPLRE